jgi:hypothetical protein
MATKSAKRSKETNTYLNKLQEADKEWKKLVQSGTSLSDAHNKVGISHILAN